MHPTRVKLHTILYVLHNIIGPNRHISTISEMQKAIRGNFVDVFQNEERKKLSRMWPACSH